MRITGCVPGSLAVKEYGIHASFGVSAISDMFTKIIISEKCAIDEGWASEKLRDNTFYTLSKPFHIDLVFHVDRWGTYSMPIKEFQALCREQYKISHPVDVIVPPQQLAYTQSQRDRANMVTYDHHRSLMHISLDQIKKASEANLLLNAPYRARYVQHAVQIQAPCERCIKFKGTRPTATSTFSTSPDTAGQMLCADILYLCGVPYLYTVCRLTKYASALRLMSKSAPQLLVGICKALGVWKSYNIRPCLLSFDREPAVNAMASELWSQDQLKVIMTTPEGHEKVIERAIRPLKDHIWACCDTRSVVEGIMFDYITLANHFANGSTFPESPRSFVSGERLDLSKWR
jgi:hypothetical protein